MNTLTHTHTQQLHHMHNCRHKKCCLIFATRNHVASLNLRFGADSRLRVKGYSYLSSVKLGLSTNSGPTTRLDSPACLGGVLVVRRRGQTSSTCSANSCRTVGSSFDKMFEFHK